MPPLGFLFDGRLPMFILPYSSSGVAYRHRRRSSSFRNQADTQYYYFQRVINFGPIEISEFFLLVNIYVVLNENYDKYT